ncbi:MAG TPA: penicillin-binding protein 2 [Chitinophagaceae bacterium]|nr:penicillin-binding protein 2 [Chitinophagaceae bacterium]
MPVFNQSRSRIIRLIFLVSFVIIVAQLFKLQIISGEYSKLAMNNAVFPKIVYPERGIIYDRKGKAILNNSIMFDLMVTPAEVKNFDTASFCRLMEIDTAEFKKRIRDAAFKNTSVRPSVFESLLTPQMQARFEENGWRFPGFALVERPVRVYPFNAAAHILGYIGEVDPKDIERSSGFYRMGDYTGKSGLENTYEKVLMGQRGVQHIIKDNHNRLVGSYENGLFDTAAIAGRGVRTYLDVELQQLAEKLLTGKIGSIVALEPKTGGILAMASGPGFNPNELTGSDKQKNYARLVLDVSKPLFNRAIKGQYPAGSTYKPIGALIGLDEGVITPQSGIACTGAYYYCGRRYGCTEHWAGHANNLRLAIAWSCNSFFYNTFRLTVDNPAYKDPRKGLTAWKNYMSAFGYGHRLGVDIPSEDGGNIPDTTQYDKEYRGSWNSCTMVTIGIGQDKMLATPLQIANGISIVANKGYYYVPHFVKTIDDESPADTALLNKYRVKHEVLTHIPDSSYETVISGMQDVTIAGTAARIPKIPGVNVCAKTGTAENYGIIKGKRTQLKDHSLFVCFAPREDPKIAVAVIIENGGFGATWAGPIAYLMMEKYLKDTLRADRLKEVDRIAAANLMPPFLKDLQRKEDSIRAFKRFEMWKDSAYIRKYITMEKPKQPSPSPKNKQSKDKAPALLAAILPGEKRSTTTRPNTTAL